MPVVIKRYQNRKLYNTQSRRYITLEEIAELIRDEQEIKVVDNLNGNDITAVILSQLIFESEKDGSGFLPVKLLVSLVQSGGNKIDVIRRNIFNSLSLFHHYDVEIERRINYLIDHGELTQEEGSKFMDNLLEAGQQLHDNRADVEGSIYQYLRFRQIPTGNDFHRLIQKIDKLSKRVDELNVDRNNQPDLD
jgi:polyhydroxyalkanoate synthesis repressor PhaR